ncbi:GNAT family N-acetyltransferase [Micromonospora siamensis]|uniref:Acetyltransferase (GNAT) domain-containing protein n=1 Tax=Micromonospora siamensis TaxID=299152 RepID=A0A1C5HJQ8_9ACTN|nr:GNAT family N-acetyltransferase [Micromonospora siamensis]SCG46163.1 Acetyltransferase (GNAT) domain-containing protein [Micromonospora siamensis]
MSLRFVLNPELTPTLRDQIVDLWVAVTNAGGAVGFVAPVTADEVRPVAERTFADTTDGPDRLLVGYAGERPVAVLFFADNRFALSAHWGTLKRVMVHPDTQGRGYGRELMREAARRAPELGWRALLVTIRGGQGLESFYGGLGFREVGRLPAALRVAPGDERDEIVMWQDLATAN